MDSLLTQLTKNLIWGMGEIQEADSNICHYFSKRKIVVLYYFINF